MGKVIFAGGKAGMNKPVALPSGYTKLAYIQSSGTQYINTGFNPNQDTRVVMDIQATGASGIYFTFGARQANTSNSFCFFHYEGWQADYQTSNNRQSLSGVAFTDRLHVDFNKSVCTANDATASFTDATFQAPVAMVLLAVNTNGTISGQISAKVFSCQIYDNGTLVRDFIPCISDAGAIGLYDLVGKQFYANAGTGTFTGSEVA